MCNVQCVLLKIRNIIVEHLSIYIYISGNRDKYEKLNIFRDQKYDGCSIDICIYIIERFENIMIHDWHKYFHLKFHTSYTISFSARCLIISVSTRLFFNTPLVPLSLDWTNMRKQTLGKAEIKSRKKKKKKKEKKK